MCFKQLEVLQQICTGESEDFPVLDGLTMWSLAFNRPWQSSSLSFLLGRTLDRTSATKTSVKND